MIQFQKKKTSLKSLKNTENINNTNLVESPTTTILTKDIPKVETTTTTTPKVEVTTTPKVEVTPTPFTTATTTPTITPTITPKVENTTTTFTTTTTTTTAKVEPSKEKVSISTITSEQLSKEVSLKRKEIIENLIKKILKNDPNLIEIRLDNQQMDDYDVIDICEALKTNKVVQVLDFSSNPNITGDCMGTVVELLPLTKTLDQLLFQGCPIEHDKVDQLIEALEKNKTLTQCLSGDNETPDDISKIETIMDRNYQNK